VRALDTRTSGFELSGRWGDFQTRNLTLAGRFGVPANAAAVAVNVTVATATKPTFLRLSAAGAVAGATSTVNVDPGKVVPNMAIAKLGTGGQISIYNLQGATDVIVDVVGWYD
jgi:serine protease